ncbi:hypothetical protein GGR50DRAFT_690106 [Xylaria sp. CBS 124048]|nr:hypothetical protein GGR50DRAFT_690106 [Xylaria sp. CBS 124048]
MAKKRNNRKANGRARPQNTSHTHAHRTSGATSDRNNSSYAQFHGYSLVEEARNTASNRRGIRVRDGRLRYQPIAFISAGVMDPLKAFDIPRENPSSERAGAADAADATDAAPDVIHGLTTAATISTSSNAQLRGADHAVCRQPSQPGDGHPDGESDPGSDSSVEVILFKGRNADRQQKESTSSTPTSDKNVSNDSIGLPEFNLPLRSAVNFRGPPVNSDLAAPAEEVDYIPLEEDQRTKSSSHKSRFFRGSDDNDEEAAIIADYIANIQNDTDDEDGNDDEDEQETSHPGLGSHSFSILRDLGGTYSDAIPISSGSESEDELHDEGTEDGMAHSESEDARLAQLIGQQEALGLQDDDVLYFDGADLDDAWLAAPRASRHKKKGTPRRSRLFHEGSQFPSATRMAEAFDELDLMDMQGSRLRRSKKGPISFGLSDSELEEALNVAIKKDRLKKADKKKARQELRSQGFLDNDLDPNDLRVKYDLGMSLDELADEFEIFMLGTHEQLILPPLHKSSRKIVHVIANSFNVKSRSAGWGNSRYPVLYRRKNTLPYDRDRLEKALGRVRHSWFQRMDVDEKDSLTAAAIKRREANARKRDEGRAIKRAETQARAGKPRSKWSLGLREGEIVGQHATEIGAENKGRAMLEKMGWSKGMSLGTIENKGITVPLTHVMKKTKAGLGDTY